MNREPTVSVIDDDAAMRSSLRRLISSVGLAVETYRTALEFLEAFDPTRPGCVVLDVRMPEMSGLELQAKLRQDGQRIPVIIITAHADVAMAVGSMKSGAVDFIEKPFRPQYLLERIQEALTADARDREIWQQRAEVQSRLANLTPRERQVVDLVVEGQTSRRIADHLGLSPKTIHVHRSEAMGKLNAGSVAELARLMVIATNGAGTS